MSKENGKSALENGKPAIKENGKATIKEHVKPALKEQDRSSDAAGPDREAMELIEKVKAVAKASKLPLENVLQIFEIMELKRCNDICREQGHTHDDHMDKITRTLDDISRSVKDVGDSVYYISEARR